MSGLKGCNESTQTVNGDKRPFVSDVVTENDDMLVSEGQSPAKRRRRA
jgi:hypothetical protein